MAIKRLDLQTTILRNKEESFSFLTLRDPKIRDRLSVSGSAIHHKALSRRGTTVEHRRYTLRGKQVAAG